MQIEKLETFVTIFMRILTGSGNCEPWRGEEYFSCCLHGGGSFKLASTKRKSRREVELIRLIDCSTFQQEHSLG